jgi:hypothetical protein
MASIRKPGVQREKRLQAGTIGNLASASSSSGFSAVVIGPWKKSLAAIRRGPPVLTGTYSAPSVAAIKLHSAAGSASARLPQKVPRTRIG